MANPDNNEFTFKNVIDGFNSYMNRSELPIDRQDLLDNIRMLEKMSVESNSSDIFEDFLKSYINIFKSLYNISIWCLADIGVWPVLRVNILYKTPNLLIFTYISTLSV